MPADIGIRARTAAPSDQRVESPAPSVPSITAMRVSRCDARRELAEFNCIRRQAERHGEEARRAQHAEARRASHPIEPRAVRKPHPC